MMRAKDPRTWRKKSLEEDNQPLQLGIEPVPYNFNVLTTPNYIASLQVSAQLNVHFLIS